MKVILSISLLLFTLSSIAQAPKYLILKHRDKQKEVVITEGEYVSIKTFKGDKVRGQMLVLSEKLIKVKHKVVPLTNVKSIGRRGAGVGRVASLVVTTGMNLLLYGISDNLRNGWNEMSQNYRASLPMLAVGIPLITTTYKRKSKNWKYEGQLTGW